MAMSLEDLLAEEGFKRTKSKLNPRPSFASDGGRSVPPHRQRNKHDSGPLPAVRRTERTRSDIPRYDSKGEFIKSSSSPGSGKPRDNNLIKIESGFKKGTSSKHKTRGHRDSWDGKRFSIGNSEITEVVKSDEIVEVEMKRSYKDIYSNKVYGHDEKERNTTRDTVNKTTSLRQTELEEALASPALDEAAIKAIISILCGHMKRFVNDEEFRASLHHKSFASLNVIGLGEGESKVVENLEQAIDIVERAAEDSATLKELKRASLQLSVITGLNSDDLKNGFTSGIPNYKLSACAHLYLSAIFMIQKKDRISAKHLLQVFCDSPFQARTTLLPDLWDYVFLPHLLHLKLWYDKETHSVADSPVFANMKLLEIVYNERLDSVTYQFAMYYKDWITEGVEAPSFPVIKLPSLSVQLLPRGGLHGHTSSPASHASPQPMVSKRLYNEVFRHSNKSAAELQVYEEQNSEISGRKSDSPATEDKQLILYDPIASTNQNIEDDGESPTDNFPVAEDAWKLLSESSSQVAKNDENYGSCQWHQGNASFPYMLQSLQAVKEEKTVLKDGENQVVELKQIEQPSIQEEHEAYEFSIPGDFLCPLTRLLFQDPVTLETGQTYEREAITDWFGKGCISCPMTGKLLLYQAVPPTNLILKRVIDKWKTDHLEHLLDLLSQVAETDGCNENKEDNDSRTICVLRQLLSVLSKDERIANARQILSFGGLQFLLRRFHCSKTREKSLILPLLSCCIEADAGCRTVIAEKINPSSLVELLHSEKLKSRTNAVLLLNELVCLNRRSGVIYFLEGLQDEEIRNAMDDLLVYLETCRSEEMPLVAVLLLHLDLLSETNTSNVYRQEAVDALTTVLERSLLSDEKVQKKCSRALLILGAFFSSSGKLMTEDWILKLAGFLNGPDWDGPDNESNGTTADSIETTDDYLSEDGEEENAREKWLMSLSASLVGDGKKSFLDTLSRCLNLGSSELVRVCLTTVAWLSFSLASLPDTEFQLSAFSSLISPLKKCLEYGKLVEHKILASLSLLNFSTIPECRVLLMQIAEEIGPCLENLEEVTWTAKELCIILSGQRR